MRKMIIGIIVVVVVLFFTSCILILRAPQFGEKPDYKRVEQYAQSKNYNKKEKEFVNQVFTDMEMGFIKGLSVMWRFIRGVERGKPKDTLPVKSWDSYVEVADSTFITWFGHSAVFLELDGKRIFLDPMLGLVPSPFDFLGSPRFNPELPTSIEDIPVLDAVLISHDHYDHLDYGSVLALKGKVGRWFVPLGVDSHLLSWGVEESKITVLDWGGSARLTDTIEVICTPARHFSGRSLSDRNSTLWSSWVVRGRGKNIYFSGDGGYWSGFKEIGERYGPFDFAMVECGQYNKDWADIHMFPEQSVQALQDLRAEIGMPIHWGAFRLSLHAWDDSPKRFVAAARKVGQRYISPVIGEKINLDSIGVPSDWWQSYN